LSKFANKVMILEVHDRLGASQILWKKAASHPQIEIRLGMTVEEFHGDSKLSPVVIKTITSGKTEELTPGAVFTFIG